MNLLQRWWAWRVTSLSAAQEWLPLLKGWEQLATFLARSSLQISPQRRRDWAQPTYPLLHLVTQLSRELGIYIFLVQQQAVYKFRILSQPSVVLVQMAICLARSSLQTWPQQRRVLVQHTYPLLHLCFQRARDWERQATCQLHHSFQPWTACCR